MLFFSQLAKIFSRKCILYNKGKRRRITQPIGTKTSTRRGNSIKRIPTNRRLHNYILGIDLTLAVKLTLRIVLSDEAGRD